MVVGLCALAAATTRQKIKCVGNYSHCNSVAVENLEEHMLGITKLVKSSSWRPLGPYLLNALHITPDHPEYAIPQHVVMV